MYKNIKIKVEKISAYEEAIKSGEPVCDFIITSYKLLS